MNRRDFRAWYAALDLPPGATDQEISRAKRAYNELYHSDRLAHMSEQARAIASEKVRAANEAAQALLDPANRAARDLWVCDSQRAHDAPPPGHPDRQEWNAATPEDAAWSERPASPPTGGRRRGTPTGRLIAIGLATGGLLGTLGVVIRAGVEGRSVPAAVAGAPVVPDPVASTGVTEDLPPSTPLPARPTTVRDSIIVLPGDGRWTRPIAAGGSSFRVTFIPESEKAFYRVRIDGNREHVLLDEPGFQKITEPAGSYEFSSMTGNPVRLRLSRYRTDATAGRAVHQLAIHVPPDGGWSRRVYLGDLRVRWEADRAVGYEARDDHWRIMHILPSVGSVFFEPYPNWIQFRSTDSLPLTLTVWYATR